MAKPDEYYIETLEQLHNVINDETIQCFVDSFAQHIIMYNEYIKMVRKEHPEETKGKSNSEILQSSFTFINDGKNDYKGVDLVEKETGKITRIRFDQEDK